MDEKREKEILWFLQAWKNRELEEIDEGVFEVQTPEGLKIMELNPPTEEEMEEIRREKGIKPPELDEEYFRALLEEMATKPKNNEETFLLSDGDGYWKVRYTPSYFDYYGHLHPATLHASYNSENPLAYYVSPYYLSYLPSLPLEGDSFLQWGVEMFGAKKDMDKLIIQEKMKKVFEKYKDFFAENELKSLIQQRLEKLIRFYNRSGRAIDYDAQIFRELWEYLDRLKEEKLKSS